MKNETYNAADDLLERNLSNSRKDKYAIIDCYGPITYTDLYKKVNKIANFLKRIKLKKNDRVLIVHSDNRYFPAFFLACIKSGIIPIPVNTMLTTKEYEFMLADSQAKGIFVSDDNLIKIDSVAKVSNYLKFKISSGLNNKKSFIYLQDEIKNESDVFRSVKTFSTDNCFWLYSSGSTGNPKGTMHVHSSLIETYNLYAKPVLKITESDIIFSAAKLFFAYGLGNSLTFPMSVGATCILYDSRPTPEEIFKILNLHKPTIFFGVPTLYGAMLSNKLFFDLEKNNLRICISAGEPLPSELGKRWLKKTKVPILDGIGSTEMLHIFLSNKLDDFKFGTTGNPLDGYKLKLLNDKGEIAEDGELGDLYVKGPTRATGYWNNTEKTKDTFINDWVKSGDKYSVNKYGYYVYCGRGDDMLKVSGQYVSPFEVESALLSNKKVLEAAVIGFKDSEGLLKPKAYVVLKDGYVKSKNMEQNLKEYVKEVLAPFKYPRWIVFTNKLPKTATGKIQRFKLRKKF